MRPLPDRRQEGAPRVRTLLRRKHASCGPQLTAAEAGEGTQPAATSPAHNIELLACRRRRVPRTVRRAVAAYKGPVQDPYLGREKAPTPVARNSRFAVLAQAPARTVVSCPSQFPPCIKLPTRPCFRTLPANPVVVGIGEVRPIFGRRDELATFPIVIPLLRF